MEKVKKKKSLSHPLIFYWLQSLYEFCFLQYVEYLSLPNHCASWIKDAHGGKKKPKNLMTEIVLIGRLD